MSHKSSEPEPRPLSVFLVEDDTLIQMMVADMIEELGHSVTAQASDLNQALSLAQTADFDVAILDVNLKGQRIDPVAEALSRRDLPFIFASGYRKGCRIVCFRDRPTLQKPFVLSQLAEAIEAALRTSRDAGAHTDSRQ